MGGFSTIGAVAPILSGKVVTGGDGTATITFPARVTKPQVLLMPEADGVVAAVVGWVTDGGNYTGVVIRTYYHVPSVSKTTESVVKSVSVSTGTVLSDVTPSTGTFVTGISVDRRNFTTASAVTGVSVSTGTFVTGIPSTTGDAAGRYTVDANRVVHHDHPIGSPTTGTAVTGVSTSTGTFVTGITTTSGTAVVANVSASTGTAVTGISKSTATVVTGIASSAASVLSDVGLSASPAANVTVHYVIV